LIVHYPKLYHILCLRSYVKNGPPLYPNVKPAIIIPLEFPDHRDERDEGMIRIFAALEAIWGAYKLLELYRQTQGIASHFLPWKRWARRRKQRFLSWGALTGLTSVLILLGTWTAATGSHLVFQLNLGTAATCLLISTTIPCSHPYIRGHRWARAMRDGLFVVGALCATILALFSTP
jgi:hypothetical protein